jgi:hypothetical protein
VLTGFVETIANLVADCEEWQKIRSCLGPVLRAHGDGWLSFHGLGR